MSEDSVEKVKKSLRLVTGMSIKSELVKRLYYNPRRCKDIYCHPSTKLTSWGGILNLADSTDPRKFGRRK